MKQRKSNGEQDRMKERGRKAKERERGNIELAVGILQFGSNVLTLSICLSYSHALKIALDSMN